MTKTVDEYKVEVRQFLTKPSQHPKFKDNPPVPMRKMYGYIDRQTPKAVYMVLRGKAEPSDNCCICGRKITNPTSLQYGIGSECITKVMGAVPRVSDDQLDSFMKELQEKTSDIVWEGWLPKGYINMELVGQVNIEEQDVTVESKVVDPLLVRQLVPILENILYK